MNGLSFELSGMVGVIIVLISSLILLISSNWRWSISALLLQYIGVFLLIFSLWSLPMSLTKVVTGWISALVMATAITGLPQEHHKIREESRWAFLSSSSSSNNPISANLFRLIAAGVVGLAIISIVTEAVNWVPGIEVEQILGALILIGLGLLHLGLTSHPFRVVLGLLTVLSGFEILYAAVEISALVAGLQSGVNLGLALVGAYFIVAPTMEVTR
jgi:hypothetical protein